MNRKTLQATIWRSAVWILAAIVSSATVATATTVTIATSYDGMAVTDSLPNHLYGQVRAYQPNTGSVVVFDDQLTDGEATFELDPATYNLSVVVSSVPVDGRSAAPGDLRGTRVNIEVPDQGSVEFDYPLQYAVHITSPLDNAVPWSGNILTCPKGPEVPSSFTLAWESVPNATRYEVILQHLACTDIVEDVVVSTTDTSVAVTIDPDVAPSLSITIRGFSDRGYSLVTSPRMVYDDAATDHAKVHAAGSGIRLSQSTASLTALQVARVPGVGDSFWTSDLTISNPTTTDLTASLVFTPRNSNGMAHYETATVDIPSGATRTVRDVVGDVFGLTGAGSIELRPRSLQAWVRTSTTAAAGRYGQGYPMLAPDDSRVLSLGGASRVGAGGVIRGDGRTNLALAELWGVGTSVRVRLFNRDGGELGSTEIDLGPFENQQLNDIVQRLAGGSAQLNEGRVTVEFVTGGGRVAAALSVVDNGSNDPTTVMLEPY
jgi:hypothetical protein